MTKPPPLTKEQFRHLIEFHHFTCRGWRARLGRKSFRAAYAYVQSLRPEHLRLSAAAWIANAMGNRSVVGVPYLGIVGDDYYIGSSITDELYPKVHASDILSLPVEAVEEAIRIHARIVGRGYECLNCPF